jgi:hypothetical protein
LHLFRHLDVQSQLRDQLLQSAILLLKLAQPLHIGGLQHPVALPPAIDRLIANAVLLGDLRYGF